MTPLPRPPGWPNATTVARFLAGLDAPPGHRKPLLTPAERVEHINAYLEAERRWPIGITPEEHVALLKARTAAAKRR